MKIDIFNHVFPAKFREELLKRKPALEKHRQLKQFEERAAWDIQHRIQMLTQYGDMMEALTIGEAPLDLFSNREAVEITRIGNDALAEIVATYPRLFMGVASLYLLDMEAALKETDRAIRELGFKGVLVTTNVAGKPLDSPEFMPLYQKMAEYDLPIWIHPHRDSSVPDYTTEKQSKYGLHALFGWPYETSAAMTRLVFCGVFDKYPHIKIITHHCGGIVPFFHRRIMHFYDLVEKADLPGEKFSELGLTKPPVEYFKMFYNDTAICGNTAGLMCGYDFFGADHLLFATDTPMDNEHGHRLLRETIQSVEEMAIPAEDKQKIYYSNARKLLHLP
jgi:predicted TIM-barrel fold metal-dependent hydrolase